MMNLSLCNQFGRYVDAEVIVTADDVVLKLDKELIGTFPRQQVESWLERPAGDLANGRTTLMAVPNGVALGVKDQIPLWPLHDNILLELREILAEADA